MAAINFADKVAISNRQASKVMRGTVQVWPQFKPNNIAGCAIWLDASKLHLANNAVVSTWKNWGSGSQPTILASPRLLSNTRNGLPVVRIYKGVGKIRFYSGTGVDRDWTLIYYGRKWVLSPGRVVTALGSASNLLVGYHGDEMDMCYVEEWITSSSMPTATAQWRLYSADATSTGASRFFIDGVQKGWGTGTPAKGWGGTLCVSGYTDDADVAVSQEASCDLAELVMYNRRISDAERQQVESYLRTKWGAMQLFKPTDLYDYLHGWFDAADPATVQIAGSGVSNWVNKGHSNYSSLTLTQNTNDAWRPAYLTNVIRFTSPQQFASPGYSTAYDIALVSKPNHYNNGEWRTLLRSPTSAHQLILEVGSTRMGTYYGGFQPAGGPLPPTMTSNSAPAPYSAVASSEYPGGGYEAWRAFDADPATCWHTADPLTTAIPYIQIDLGAQMFVASYKYQARNPGPYQAWKDWQLDGWTGSAWVRLDTVVNEPNFYVSEVRTYACDTPGAFRWLRWTITATWGSHAEAAKLELFSTSNGASLTWDSVWGIGYGRVSQLGPVLLSRDGGALFSTGATIPSSDTPFVSFGAYQGPPPSQGWGDIGEVIFIQYGKDNFKQLLEGYLAHRWGLAHLLPANHYYKNTPP